MLFGNCNLPDLFLKIRQFWKMFQVDIRQARWLGVIMARWKHDEANTAWVETQSCDLRLMTQPKQFHLSDRHWVAHEPHPCFGLAVYWSHTQSSVIVLAFIPAFDLPFNISDLAVLHEDSPTYHYWVGTWLALTNLCGCVTKCITGF